MVLGVELERDLVSNIGALKETCEHNGRYKMTGFFTNDVRGVIEELCIVIADIDPMGDRGGRGIPWGGGSG